MRCSGRAVRHAATLARRETTGRAAGTEGRSAALDASLITVLEILRGMGIAEASPDAVLTSPAFHRNPLLLEDSAKFSQFAIQAAVRLGFVGYPTPPEDAAFLTVREFREIRS